MTVVCKRGGGGKMAPQDKGQRKALVVYCHPRTDSFTAAVRDRVLAQLAAIGAEARLIDLYAMGFDPVMMAAAHRNYALGGSDAPGLQPHIADLQWCDTLIFVYPTWWYGLPAMLKGWLDRVLLPGVAFVMPDATHKDIRPGLTRITGLAVFTTCGASWWLTHLIGAPGWRSLMRGVRLLCAKGCKTGFAVHYAMDQSTPRSRAAHLDKVAAQVNRLILARRA